MLRLVHNLTELMLPFQDLLYFQAPENMRVSDGTQLLH